MDVLLLALKIVWIE